MGLLPLLLPVYLKLCVDDHCAASSWHGEHRPIPVLSLQDKAAIAFKLRKQEEACCSVGCVPAEDRNGDAGDWRARHVAHCDAQPPQRVASTGHVSIAAVSGGVSPRLYRATQSQSCQGSGIPGHTSSALPCKPERYCAVRGRYCAAGLERGRAPTGDRRRDTAR